MGDTHITCRSYIYRFADCAAGHPLLVSVRLGSNDCPYRNDSLENKAAFSQIKTSLACLYRTCVIQTGKYLSIQ